MGLGGGKMTRATGTSTKTTSLSRAGVASGKTGMTGANGCLKVMVLGSGQNRCLLEACLQKADTGLQPKAHPNKLEGNQAWSFHWGKTEAKPLFHA